MPAIENFHDLPDMGRMTPRLPLGDLTGYSPEAFAPGNVRLP
jgi:hypothetical protein